MHAPRSEPLPLAAAAALSAHEGALLAALPRHRHDLSRDAVRASQIARVLVATAELVAEKGYADAGVAAIAERAGVSTKTFYVLFTGKEEAFLATYAAIDVVIAGMSAAALRESGPRAMLRAGARAYLEALAAEPAFTRMLVIEAVGAGPRVLERRARAFDSFVATLRAPLGSEAPDEALTLAALGGINELVLQHLLAKGAESLPELLPTVSELLERVLLPRG